MKKLLRSIFKLILTLLFPGALLAQQHPDYSILLNSGRITPRENVQTLKADAEIFRNSAFQGKSYVVLQFKTLPDQQQKVRISAAGIQLIDYLPNLAYTAAIPQNLDPVLLKNFNIRSVFQLSPEQKTVPALLRQEIPAHAVNQTGYADLTLITYEKLSSATLRPEFSKLQISVLEELPIFRTFTIRVPQKNISRLLALPFVQWLEPIDAPNVAENLLGRTLHRVNILNDGLRNLKGDSIKIGIWDGGEVSPHLDFSPVTSRLTLMETSSPSSHATHCAGTIGGRGIINPKARGMAPNAKIYSYNFSGNIPSEMSAAIPALGLNISSHSYGSTQTCGVTGAGVAYSNTSRNTDLNLNTYPDHLHVHSAGNSQSACSGGWSTITGSGKTAKNNILVANITSTQNINNSSSFGPVHDGRVKPEISALGTNVLSTYTPLNTYGTITGTSMSTPGISGSLALLVERYKQLNGNTNPISSLIKNVVCNTAHDLGNPGPDYKYGFGRINALSAVKTLEQNRYVVNTIATGATSDVSITVPSGAVKLKVMLTWNDPAGTVNSSMALVNNLDLEVLNGTTATLPWVLNPNSPNSNATRATDNISNIEQVTIDNPAAGIYTLRVLGTSVPSGANQQYSLTWEVVEPYIEVIYPNGGESFSPGSQETITWDNAGVTGNQTLQYSVNNGTTWTTISSSVSATTTRYTWTVPAGLNTANALIKVSRGTLSDQSDAVFNILGIPSNLSATPGQCAGTLNFTWNNATNATHFDLLQLDLATGQWNTLANNISGNSYTANGLQSGVPLWFSLVARNNLTGSISERTNAITRSLPASVNMTIGAISGPVNICTTGQSFTYSVVPANGASTYNWSVPAGATIVSGQGTTSIQVQFPGASVAGNISVYGVDGSCQTNTQTLAVAAGSSITPPASQGDQIVCDINPTPFLTAAATAPAGYSVVWYTDSAGGQPITQPILNRPGQVTYYAASRSTNGNCESATRTPVTLTINPSIPALISATQTTICQNGEAVLTANSGGSSYLWSTGETTQSITVKQPGTYMVTINQANNCSNTSEPVTITSASTPEVSLSVDPYTQLQPGRQTVLVANTPATGKLLYSWFRNGMYLHGKNEATLTVDIDALGEYEVKVTSEQGCTGTSEKINLTAAPSDDLYIYPNPNNGQFQIRFQNQTNGETYILSVFDSKGALVFKKRTSPKEAYQKIAIDLGKAGSGVYWLLVQDSKGNKAGSGRIAVQ